MSHQQVVVRLTKSQRELWMRRLSSWQTPESMIAKTEELGELLGPEVLVQPRAGFFREAFCAGKFARERAADKVRLIYPDERPDFELSLSGRPIQLDAAGTTSTARGRHPAKTSSNFRRRPG